MIRLLIIFLAIPFSLFSQQKSGIVNMDTIQKYHPFTVKFKKDYLALAGKYTDTLKTYRKELQDFERSLPNNRTISKENQERGMYLQTRANNFEKSTRERLLSFTRVQTTEFLALFRKQLDAFILQKKLSFLIDKSLLVYCAPCDDYSKEVLEWIKKNKN
jgi:Skp family chaperone for outer membrane proteins